ncbi:MAG: hypothetical protein ACFBSD_10785 [Paracoccaceae bacterium]
MGGAEELWVYPLWIGGSGLAAWIAHRQGRHPFTTFVASLIVTPLLALPILWYLGPKTPASDPTDGEG